MRVSLTNISENQADTTQVLEVQSSMIYTHYLRTIGLAPVLTHTNPIAHFLHPQSPSLPRAHYHLPNMHVRSPNKPREKASSYTHLRTPRFPPLLTIFFFSPMHIYALYMASSRPTRFIPALKSSLYPPASVPRPDSQITSPPILSLDRTPCERCVSN